MAYRPTDFSLRVGLLATVVWGCGAPGTPVVVDVSPLPPQAVSLRLVASLGQAIGSDSPTFDLPPLPRNQDFTFSFHLPDDLAGQDLAVAAEARDPMGCVLAFGVNAPTVAVTALSGLKVPLTALSRPDCGAGLPRSLLVTPGQISTMGTDLAGQPVRAVISGWGFLPGASVHVDGQPATAVTWVSPIEIDATLPSRQGDLGMGLKLMVTNPDGSQDPRGDLLSRGYYGALGFAPPGPSIGGFSIVAISDLDGDGKPDLLGIDAGNNAVIVYLNKGDGTFPMMASYPVGAVPASVTAADLNGDGKPDLAVATAAGTQGSVIVLLNQGKGKFPLGTPASYPVAGPAHFITAADLDRDGKIDLAVATTLGAVSVLRNQGGGTFPMAAPSYAAGGVPRSIIAQDLDGDGAPELVVNARTGTDPLGSVRVFLNLNDGHGSLAVPPRSPFPGIEADAVRVLDLNGDGKPDLAAITRGKVYVVLNRGPMGPAEYPTSGRLPLATVAFNELLDLNGDGRPDIVSANADGSMNVFLNRGQGMFATSPIISPPIIASVTGNISFALGDFNRDGRPDVIGCTSTGVLGLLINQGTGALAPASIAGGSALLATSGVLFPADFDGDGKLDLAANVPYMNGPGTVVLLSTAQ